MQMENASKKNKVMELEEEMKKLSGQQNLQQRIHHHAKIKVRFYHSTWLKDQVDTFALPPLFLQALINFKILTVFN